MNISLQEGNVTVRLLLHGIQEALTFFRMGTYQKKYIILMKTLRENENTISQNILALNQIFLKQYHCQISPISGSLLCGAMKYNQLKRKIHFAVVSSLTCDSVLCSCLGFTIFSRYTDSAEVIFFQKASPNWPDTSTNIYQLYDLGPFYKFLKQIEKIALTFQVSQELYAMCSSKPDIQ